MTISRQILVPILAVALATGLGGVSSAEHNLPDFMFTAGPSDDIQVGNAGSECRQLGELLDVDFVYAHKWNEGEG